MKKYFSIQIILLVNDSVLKKINTLLNFLNDYLSGESKRPENKPNITILTLMLTVCNVGDKCALMETLHFPEFVYF